MESIYLEVLPDEIIEHIISYIRDASDLVNFLNVDFENINRIREDFNFFKRLFLISFSGIYPEIETFLNKNNLSEVWSYVYVDFLNHYEHNHYNLDLKLLEYEEGLPVILYQSMLYKLDPEFFEQLIRYVSVNVYKEFMSLLWVITINYTGFDWEHLYLLYKEFSDDMEGISYHFNTGDLNDMVVKLFENILNSSYDITKIFETLNHIDFFGQFLLQMMPYDYKDDLLNYFLQNNNAVLKQNRLWLFKFILDNSDDQLNDVKYNYQKYKDVLKYTTEGKKLLKWIDQKIMN